MFCRVVHLVFACILFFCMDITKPADIKFLREQVVSRTAGVVTNGPGCSVAGDSLLAEIHCCQRFTKMTDSRVRDTVIYLYMHSSASPQ